MYIQNSSDCSKSKEYIPHQLLCNWIINYPTIVNFAYTQLSDSDRVALKYVNTFKNCNLIHKLFLTNKLKYEY
jgi:hypothetical protein